MIGIKKLHQFSLLVSAIALTGCGGQSDDGSPSVAPPSDPTPMLAMDGFSTVAPDVETFIDLRPFLRGNDVRITDIQADEDNALCGAPTVNGLGVNVEVKDGAFCQFTYTATQSGAPLAKASMNVLATKATEPTLPPISQAMVVGAGNGTFDLQVLLGSSWKGTYVLNADSVQVQGMEGNLGSKTVTNNTIVFTPPELPGWNRIVFILDDTAAPSKSVMGVIYVTISEKVNQPPIIPIPKYPYQFVTTPFDKEVSAKDLGCSETSCSADTVAAAMGSARTVFLENKNGRQNINLPPGDEYHDRTITIRNYDAVNTSVWNQNGYLIDFVPPRGGEVDYRNFNGAWWQSNGTGKVSDDRVYASETLKVDLTKLKALEIEDPEGQEWQLISVHSWTADVKPFNPDSVSNKAFNFTASRAGKHYVTYVVADHYGGYSSGIIRINVTSKGGAPTWSNIETNGNTYRAPQTYEQASSEGFAVSDVWDQAVNNTVAGYTSTVAINYCSTIGALPSPTEMTALRSGPAEELAAWPKARPYIISDGGTPKSFDLSTGTIAAYNPAAVYYTTCLFDEMQLEMLTNSIIANGDTNIVAKVTMLTADGNFNIEKVDGTLLESEVAITEGVKEGRVTYLTTNSTKVGTYRFRVSNAADPASALVSSTINYLGDKETAEFASDTGLRVIKSNANILQGVGNATLVATITDVNGNPVSGIKVEPVLNIAPEIGHVVSGTILPNGSDVSNALGQVHFNVALSSFGKPGKVFAHVFTRITPDKTVISEQIDVAYVATKYPCNSESGNFDCLPTAIVGTPSVGERMMTATPSKQYLESTSYPNNGFIIDDSTFPLTTVVGGHDWCRHLVSHQSGRFWSLPPISEFEEFASQYTNSQLNEMGWPLDYPYHTFDIDEGSSSTQRYRFYNLKERRIEVGGVDKKAYASCRGLGL